MLGEVLRIGQAPVSKIHWVLSGSDKITNSIPLWSLHKHTINNSQNPVITQGPYMQGLGFSVLRLQDCTRNPKS